MVLSSTDKRIVVIAGPSGSGKNTIINHLIKKIPDSTRLVTATTRLARPGEVDKSDYYFMSADQFDHEVGAGHIAGQRFVSLYGGVNYGIYLPDLQKRFQKHHLIFAPVDKTGADYLKEKYHALTIFISPEVFSEYRTRIRSRQPDMPQHEFDMRMKIADEEVNIQAPYYDYRVLNAGGMLDTTLNEILDILKKEGYTQ